MLQSRPQLLVLVLALVMSAVVVRLVSRQQLRDRFGLVWVLIASATVGVSVVPAGWWDRVADIAGIKGRAPTLFLVLAVFGLLGLVLQLSLTVSRTERRLVEVTVRSSVQAWLQEHPDELLPRAEP